MPRGPRLDAPGVLHHVMVRGLERRALFHNDEDRADFTARLAALADRGSLVVYAWALLPNHAHLLIRTGQKPLARSMRSLLTGYAGAFNRRHRRAGHLFQNRYKSIVVEEEPYLLELVRYLHLNPLRSRVVDDMAALDSYPWTGHAALLGRVARPWQATREVLGRFAASPKRAREAYRSFVEAGKAHGQRPELQGGGLVRSLGGWHAVAALRRGREAYQSDERVLGSSAFVDDLLQLTNDAPRGTRSASRQPDLDELLRRIAVALRIPQEALRGRSRVPPAPEARHLLVYLWVEHLGRSATEVGRVVGYSRGQTSWALRRGADAARGRMREVEEWLRDL